MRKTLHQGDSFKATTTEFLSKISNRKKTPNEEFNLCEEET